MARRGGWRRVGRRKPFRYVDSRGERIEDEARLERIEALVIPPAWRDVWISPSPAARLQATGVDAAGRRQYLLCRGGDARQPGLVPRRLGAVCPIWPQLRDHDADEAPRHRSRRADQLPYRGKHRVLVRTTLVDAELADAVGALLRYEGGSRLLRYEREGARARGAGSRRPLAPIRPGQEAEGPGLPGRSLPPPLAPANSFSPLGRDPQKRISPAANPRPTGAAHP